MKTPLLIALLLLSSSALSPGMARPGPKHKKLFKRIRDNTKPRYFGLGTGESFREHTCVLRFTGYNSKGEKEGIPYCWGWQQQTSFLGHFFDPLPGEKSRFSYTNRERYRRARYVHSVRGMRDGGVTKIALAKDLTCLLKRGRIWCMGNNSSFDMIPSSEAHSPHHVVVPLPLDKMGGDFFDLSISEEQGYAIKFKEILPDGRPAGEVWGWGENDDPKRRVFPKGIPTYDYPNRGRPNILSSKVVKITTGSRQSGHAFGCAAIYNPLHKGDDVYCWGYWRYGSLGDGTSISSQDF